MNSPPGHVVISENKSSKSYVILLKVVPCPVPPVLQTPCLLNEFENWCNREQGTGILLVNCIQVS